MKKTDARVERNTLALHVLTELLQTIHQAPERFVANEQLTSALKSQSSTAALSITYQVGDTTKSTTPISLNTLKTYAEKDLPTGFDGFNRLRLAALEALETAGRREQRSNKRTKVGLSMRVVELENMLALHQKTNMILLQALSRALDDIKSVKNAPNSGLRELRATEAMKALAAITSLNAPPYNKLSLPSDTSVVNLDEYRR